MHHSGVTKPGDDAVYVVRVQICKDWLLAAAARRLLCLADQPHDVPAVIAVKGRPALTGGNLGWMRRRAFTVGETVSYHQTMARSRQYRRDLPQPDD
jgi:hypothetical protein